MVKSADDLFVNGAITISIANKNVYFNNKKYKFVYFS